MAEDVWQLLEGVHPGTSEFPARARYDGEGILIFRTDGGFRGAQRTCPHMKSSLVDAQILGQGTMLRCSQHIYTFRLSDGKGVNCPGYRIKIYEVKQENDALFARAVD
jgi:nitrite reductase/ring-hydroxylating ferredoxin subunit